MTDLVTSNVSRPGTIALTTGTFKLGSVKLTIITFFRAADFKFFRIRQISCKISV